ncbi:MAG: hypothetical protein MZW92_79570 [Comamonadaceae bacterium]|nr:hypothetical protein [Comamonadaceae bacterium]
MPDRLLGGGLRAGAGAGDRCWRWSLAAGLTGAAAAAVVARCRLRCRQPGDSGVGEPSRWLPADVGETDSIPIGWMHNMCGILGVVATTRRSTSCSTTGCMVLQHRGQDAAGIATAEGRPFPHAQGAGAGARRVPHAQHAQPARRRGASATAAIRPPARAFNSAEAQPFYVNSPFGIVLGAQRQPHQRRATEATTCSCRTCATSTPTPTPRCCSTSWRTSCRSRATGYQLDAGHDLQGGGRRASRAAAAPTPWWR